MSNGVFQKNGSSYPFESLSKTTIHRESCKRFVVSADSYDPVYTDSSGVQHVNETAYHEVGLAYSGAQYTWEIFMVSDLSSVVCMRNC